MSHCVPPELANLVAQFIAVKNPRLSCNDAAGTCADVGQQLIRFLSAAGVPARTIELNGLRTRMDASAASFYRGYPQREITHTMVLVGDWAIDLTGAQFGSRWNGLFIRHLGDLPAEWHVIHAGHELIYSDGKDTSTGRFPRMPLRRPS